LRDIAGGIAVAQIGFQVSLPTLGEHLAVTVLVEAIDHDPVIAGKLLEDRGRLTAQRVQRVAGRDPAKCIADRPGEVAGGAGDLQL